MSPLDPDVLTLTLLGVTLGLPIIIAGVVMSIWVIVRWIADTRRDINALPSDLDEH